MDFNFKTIAEFNDYFKDEKTCYQFYESQRWGDVPVCPHCASAKKPYTVKARGKFTDIPSYRCSERACDLPFTVRTGSIFEGSKVELRKWLQAIYEITIRKKGISSVELGVRIGVAQKTAWFINHRIRTMLADTTPELLSGVVECDETYVGGKISNRHVSKRDLGSLDNKTMVFGALERKGKVKTKVIPLTNIKHIQQAIKENVQENSTMLTDESHAYNKVHLNYTHETVKHRAEEYVRGYVHTNTIEGFWSLLKRQIYGIHHQVSAKHLHRYCTEAGYRYNTREIAQDERFVNAIKGCEGRLTYEQLTKKHEA